MKRLVILALSVVVLNTLAQTKTKVTVEVENDAPPPHVVVRKVALVVQNHAAKGADIPFMALTDALTAKLSGRGFQVVNPYNNVGMNQNRNVHGEWTPPVSAIELARQLGAEGAITASVLDFLDSTLGTPPILHQYSVRVSINLADAGTGAAICGETIKMKSPKYTNNQVAQNKQEYLGDLLHAAAEECAAKMEANPAVRGWRPSPYKRSLIGATYSSFGPPPPVQASTATGAKPPPPNALLMSDVDRAMSDLVSSMLDDPRFKANYDMAKSSIGGRLPIAVNGGLVNLSGEDGNNSIVEAVGATMRVILFNTALFDIKDDAAAGAMAKRIVSGGNSPVEDGELMSALKQHGSPDFFILGDLRKFSDYGGRNTYRLHLAVHTLANGKILWEGIQNIVK